MNWPPASDYQDAIQNPWSCFQDGELKGGQPALNRLGLPRVASGNFASVYQIHKLTEKWAVRCFLRQGTDQQHRYALLSEFLTRVSPPGIVEFAYLSQGIRIRSQWYPILKMEWVDGLTLYTYVSHHLHDGAKLRSLALQWRGLMERLRKNSIAHGDLQHGNVLVTPQEQLRLVDYDGMYVPPLKGNFSYELGHPNYQHPRRAATDYDEKLDNFSAIVIYTALRALIAEPGLWERFDTGENLLFSAVDYKAPSQSPLFQRLKNSSDPGVQTLAARIARSCGGAITQVPDFGPLVDSLPPIPEPEPWWRGSEPPSKGQPTAPRVPPLPTALDPKPAQDAPAPWWKKPSTSVLPTLGPAQPVMVSPSAATASRLPARRPQAPVRRRGSGCLALVGAGCLFATLGTTGAVMAARYVYHQVADWLNSSPIERPVPSSSSSDSKPAHTR